MRSRRIGRQLWLVAVVCALGSGGAFAEAPYGPAADEASFTMLYESDPIETGFVVCDGRYVPPPYLLVQRDDAVLLNGILLPQLRRSESGFEQVNHIQNKLENDGLLIVHGNKICSFGCGRAGEIFDILLSEASSAEKCGEIQALLKGQPSAGVVPWAVLVELAASNADFTSRIDGTVHQPNLPPAGEMPRGSISAQVRAAMNIAGMALAVLALGTVLLYRPGFKGNWWSSRDREGDGYRLLPRFITVVVLLSLFDLTYTMLAGRSGGFWELNPLGGLLMESPALLIAFKLAGTATGVAILWRLRPYCGAQLASWWICLVYTVLSFRWAIFNSLFFG